MTCLPSQDRFLTVRLLCDSLEITKARPNECISFSKETGASFLCEYRLSLHCSLGRIKCHQVNINLCVKVQGSFRTLKSSKQKSAPHSLCFNFRDEENDSNSTSAWILHCQL